MDIDESSRTALHGTVYPLARPEYDQGAVADDVSFGRLLLMVARSPDRERSLQQFLRDVHASGSPSYHHWLTPDEFGQRFGAPDDNLQLVSGWLQSHGMKVARVTKSKSMIEFSGTAGQIREALRTQIHRYSAQGKTFYANASEISVPQAIASRIEGFAPLNTFPLDSFVKVAGGATMNRANHRVARRFTPQFTLTENNAPFYALGPEDFATQYDVAPVYSAGIDGTGATIGIIGTNNLNLALVDAYRKLFNLPADHTQVIIDGVDPGDSEPPDIEGFLDVEVSGAIAPNASIYYYIATGQLLQDPVALAALRAIDDNNASVISVSYGQCEQLLEESGNQLWAGLWEQAAAQGQTVLVASGDLGPSSCAGTFVPLPNAVEVPGGLTVNGLSSTPWNVSVGGTDFYYADYATGGASISSLWNRANDTSLGSLTAPLPEQPWDSGLGLNIVPYLSEPATFPSPATGGGPSNCSQESSDPNTALQTCVAGYPKPAWQQAPGVPSDGMRDLPDISLFAANGANLSAWPICAEPGDCADGTTSPVTLVGGTSSSTPAMAAIMALINQRFGRQGQADYTLYALARQSPGTFHDISIGTNDILCPSSEEVGGVSPFPGCTVPYPVQYITPLSSYGVYAAGPGYDFASGLGSFDASKLILNWNQITLSPAVTSLSISPSNAQHGSAVAVTASVKSQSGTGTPTGDVALEINSAGAVPSGSLLTLAGGAASENLSALPGGTYQVIARYEGDGVFADSVSSPVTVTVTPEKSNTSVFLEYYNPVTNPYFEGIVSNGGQAPFGSSFTYTAVVSGLATGSSLATGSVLFTDGGKTTTVPLSVSGQAIWSPAALALGSHSVAVAYSGDASYDASTAAPLNSTIVKGTTSLVFGSPESAVATACQPQQGACNVGFLAGSNLIINVATLSANASTPPTGTLTVSLGSMTQLATLAPSANNSGAASGAALTFSAVPAGIYSLSANYSGDSDWNPIASTYSQQILFIADNTLDPSTTTLSASASNVDSSAAILFNVTVQDTSGEFSSAPDGTVELLSNGTPFASANIDAATLPALSQSLSIDVPAYQLPTGQQTVIAVYSGSQGLVAPSVSAAVSINVVTSDFTLSTGAPFLTVSSGKTRTMPLLLGQPYSTGVPVSLACAPSSSAFQCSISPASPTVTGSGTATLTVTASVPASTAKVDHPSSRSGRGAGEIGSVLAFVFLLGFPRRRRKWNAYSSFLLFACLTIAGGCGGGSTRQPQPPPQPQPPQSTPTQPGTYSVLVTGTSSGVTHNARLTVIVTANTAN